MSFSNTPSEPSIFRKELREGKAEVGLRNTSWFNLIVRLRKGLCVLELGKGHLQLLNPSGNVNSGLCALTHWWHIRKSGLNILWRASQQGCGGGVPYRGGHWVLSSLRGVTTGTANGETERKRPGAGWEGGAQNFPSKRDAKDQEEPSRSRGSKVPSRIKVGRTQDSL